MLRFSNGLRLKVKGDEYCRIHRMVSGLSPLSMWEAMQEGKDLGSIRRELPEEFWQDFDAIVTLLKRQIDALIAEVTALAGSVAHLTDKEVGLMLDTFPERVRRFVFPFRKGGGDLLTGRTREVLFRAIRPDANRLEGYRASSAVNRVLNEAA